MSDNPKQGFDWNMLGNETQNLLGQDFWKDFEHIFPKKHPPVDIVETATHGFIYIDMPGLNAPEELSLSINGQSLIIEGQINRPYHPEQVKTLLNERFSGQIKRSVIVPFPIGQQELQASYKNGILAITIAKGSNHYPISYTFPAE